MKTIDIDKVTKDIDEYFSEKESKPKEKKEKKEEKKDEKKDDKKKEKKNKKKKDNETIINITIICVYECYGIFTEFVSTSK